MAHETHSEAFFRALIAITELGDAVKYVTHDPILNPLARPHGSKEDEVLAIGQAIIQILSLAVARGIPCEEAVKAAYQNWAERDWQKTEATTEGQIRGITAVSGNTEGQAYVVTNSRRLEMFKSGILIAPFVQSKQTLFLISHPPLALVTDSGGLMSHPAIIARELGIITVVGTGNATQRIPHGALISVDAREEEGIIKIITPPV